MSKEKPILIGAAGLDHRHMYGQLGGMLAGGHQCRGWWTEGEPGTIPGFVKRFPDIPRVDSADALIEDPEIDLIVIASIPVDRADLAIRAMKNGKDVMVDKPGCTTLAQLEAIRSTVAETGRIWSVDFSERFEVPAVTKAAELVKEGAIGKVVQTIGMGPHRLNRHLRPDWFFEREKYGGILCDIASHQIDQFLFFADATDAEIVFSSIGNFANPSDPGLDDFGEILLRSGDVQGYIRVDWYTPDGLPNWGDGRLTILGTDGYIELRKYVDVAGREGTDHLYLVNKDRCDYIDCKDAPLSYFADLAHDIRHRTETVMPQAQVFKVMELAIRAQEQAERRGHLA